MEIFCGKTLASTYNTYFKGETSYIASLPLENLYLVVSMGGERRANFERAKSRETGTVV